MRVTISRRDTADTAIIAELLIPSLNVSLSLSLGTDVGSAAVCHIVIDRQYYIGCSSSLYRQVHVFSSPGNDISIGL